MKIRNLILTGVKIESDGYEKPTFLVYPHTKIPTIDEVHINRKDDELVIHIKNISGESAALTDYALALVENKVSVHERTKEIA